ncbi:hypothetical protein SAMN04487897_1468 [Paenibacillus sp. yr247]|uniref:DUF5808 domain-containing protein n=1 Tax=Paenibacillus sp. yr247 TaxID=1761880 RepID=UPI00088A1952|nr:DUF5808 domain-containing protein [Paenibacillus sp. yr247]SDP19963.1 hypothetical protein SAMN04487897_1468 [Paenibacillus sp. yr247]
MVDNDRKHYKLGIIYYNPNNKSIFVPKRLGLGWTINLNGSLYRSYIFRSAEKLLQLRFFNTVSPFHLLIPNWFPQTNV